MPRDLIKHQRALFLRKKKGYSYNEIREEIPVSKSTLSLWLRKVQLSEKQIELIQRRRKLKLTTSWGSSSLGEWNRHKRQCEITKIRVKAKKEFRQMTKKEFLIAGIMLYWAEGRKGGKHFYISNSDPLFVEFIMKWLRECLNISEDRFVVSIHYHQGQDEMAIRKFWSLLTGIPLNQFRKSFCKPPGTGHRKHYLQWGTVRISVRRGANLFHQICGWRDGLIEKTISGKQLQ